MSSSRRRDLEPFFKGDIDIELKPAESPEERSSRLRREEAEAAMKLWKEQCLFIIGVGIALAIGGFCLWATLDQSFSIEQQKWGMATITSMITGIIAYLCGKASK